MHPKDIVVFLEERHHGNRLEYAATLARQWQAHLVATFVARRLELDPYAGFATGTALSNLLAEYQRDVTRSVAEAREGFERLMERNGFSGEWRVSDHEPGEALMLHARHAGLAILGPPARQATSATALGLAEHLIFASGRPCLLLPDEWPAQRVPERIVVGWNGGREATRAIADAMHFLSTASAVHLVVVPEARFKGGYGQDPGADMAAHLARHGVPVVLEQCKGEDAGSVLLERSTALDADLLVMGAMGRARISEFVLGGATRTILERARLPILLSR